ncbi:hypothetical protein [Acinetobacter baumannii]|uniref:hypothetical protein n=1 Tax=Acinetobacter baumannii TaxID=470 RepID=UPI00208EED29|nr:hypothetical protein [Acinetobacter baumannii]
MDKCREEFEKQRYWIGLFRTGVDFDVTLGEFGRYISNGTKSTDAMDLESFNKKWEAWANCWQHQQAKVEELQRRNQMLNDNIKEQGQKLVYQNEVIETQAEKLLGLRDEKAELQKRVDALTLALDQIAYPIPHMQKEAELNGCELNGYWAVKMSEDHIYSKDIARRALEKEQALKDGEA